MKLPIVGQARPGVLGRYGAIPLAVLLLVAALSACSKEKQRCPDGLQEYKGKCLTHSAIVYVGCTDGKGQSLADEIRTGATLPVAANTTLGVAYKRSRQEDSVVALQIVKDCLKLAEGAAGSDAERTDAIKYQQQATRYIGEARRNLPAIALEPPGTLDCGSADVGAPPVSCQVRINSTGWSPLRITSVSKTGADREDFTVDESGAGDAEASPCVLGEAIAPGDSCTMTVTFQPSAAGRRSATLVIHQNIPRPDRGTPLELVGNGGGPAEGHSLTVTVDTSVASGGVVSDPSGIDCGDTCTGTFDDGTDVTLTATYDQGAGQVDWAGCDSAEGDTCVIHMTADHEITAKILS